MCVKQNAGHGKSSVPPPSTSSPPVISKSNPPKSADKGKEGKVPHLSPGFGSLRVSGQKLDWTPTVLEVRGLAPSPSPPFADQLCQVTPCVTLLQSTICSLYLLCFTFCVHLVQYTMEVEKFRRCRVTGSSCRPVMSRNLDKGLILYFKVTAKPKRKFNCLPFHLQLGQ